jgi:hypothetical protein
MGDVGVDLGPVGLPFVIGLCVDGVVPGSPVRAPRGGHIPLDRKPFIIGVKAAVLDLEVRSIVHHMEPFKAGGNGRRRFSVDRFNRGELSGCSRESIIFVVRKKTQFILFAELVVDLDIPRGRHPGLDRILRVRSHP